MNIGNKTQIPEKTTTQKLISHYKQENAVIKDKLADADMEIVKMIETIGKLKETCKKLNSAKEYWEFRYNKKYTWFNGFYGYGAEPKLPDDFDHN